MGMAKFSTKILCLSAENFYRAHRKKFIPPSLLDIFEQLRQALSSGNLVEKITIKLSGSTSFT